MLSRTDSSKNRRGRENKKRKRNLILFRSKTSASLSVDYIVIQQLNQIFGNRFSQYHYKPDWHTSLHGSWRLHCF